MTDFSDSGLSLIFSCKLSDLFVVQNVHLVARWLPCLEALLETAAVNSHPSYRVFITGEPVQSPEQHVIPRGILENAIKITNEPPTGMNASLHAALNNFSQVCRKLQRIFISYSKCRLCFDFVLIKIRISLVSGGSRYVFQRARVQLHVLLPLLLSCLCNRAPQIWSTRVEPQLPLQHRRPHHFSQCVVQLPRGQH